jgi:cystathionine gamma-synthase
MHALRQSQGMLGGVIDPHAAYLLERGLKTLALRVQQQNESAQAVAEFLESHPRIERVWYPGLPSHPDHETAASRCAVLAASSASRWPCRPAKRRWTRRSLHRRHDHPPHRPSLGGVESLIEQPALMSYYELSTEERLPIGIKDNLVRFAIGIEETADILADLEQALS